MSHLRTYLFWAIFLALPILFAKEADKKPEIGPLRQQANEMLEQGEALRSQHVFSGEVTRLKAQCPACPNTFTAYHLTDATSERGIDRDFCKHPLHLSNIDLDVWTCIQCGYSHLKNFFNQKLEKPLPEKLKENLEMVLVKNFIDGFGVNIKKVGFEIDQQDIPAGIKYSLMSLLLPHLDLPWKIRADFHLKFAWSERLRSCASIRSSLLSNTLGNINQALRTYEKRHQLEPIMSDPAQVLLFLNQYAEKNPDRQTTFATHLHRSSQYNRLGFLHSAQEELKKAILMENPEPIRSTAVFRNRLLENQVYHLKEAVIATKEAIRSEEHDFEELLSSIYLLGELQRRIGLFAEAEVWFDAYLELEEPTLRSWASEQRSALPKNIGLAPDSEKVLAQKAQDLFRKLKKGQLQKGSPKDITNDQVRRWLSEIQIAAMTYHRKYKLDPENLKELFQLGFLKGQPDLMIDHLRFFKLDANPVSSLSSTRYTVHCLLPLFDEKGSFMASSAMGKLIRTPTQ